MTTTKVSVLQKILTYFELAAAIGMEIPEPHVKAISTLIEELSQDLANSQLVSGQPPAPVVMPQQTAQERFAAEQQKARQAEAEKLPAPVVTLPAPAAIPAAPAPSSEAQGSVSASESVSHAGSIGQDDQHQ